MGADPDYGPDSIVIAVSSRFTEAWFPKAGLRIHIFNLKAQFSEGLFSMSRFAYESERGLSRKVY